MDALARRIEVILKLASAQPDYLYDVSTFRETFNIVAMRWLNLGSDEVRNMYDQLYMSGQQYQLRAAIAANRAKSKLAAGNRESATALVLLADFNLRQMRAAYAASIDIFSNDLRAAEFTAKYPGSPASKYLPESGAKSTVTSKVAAPTAVPSASVSAEDPGIPDPPPQFRTSGLSQRANYGGDDRAS